ncbi:unnamed protein product [Closterium sp. Naga37s-1]|nr:unnamed protein product [Closterium sp. Naga37s-1]CAI5524755.1 unnamed protein product [Closterium sp. Naga37s-1]
MDWTSPPCPNRFLLPSSLQAMIVALDVGSEVPWMGVSPWDGLQLGDLVAPFFLFASGAAAALTFRAVHSRTAAVHRILRRACCLFLLGLFLEGGFFHRTGDLSFGISLTRMRICGTLQRIAVAYTVVALAQVLLSAPKDCHAEGRGEGLSGLLSFSLLTWQASLMLAAIYLALTFLLFVPDWTFTPPTSSASLSAVNSSFIPHAASLASSTPQDLMVVCSRSGDLSPACSAAGYIDRLLLSTNHLLASPPYTHLPMCSGNYSVPAASPPSLLALPSSGDKSPPVWCSAPFEPMGLLSTLGATLTAFMGLHLGHIITSFQSHAARIINCLLFSALLMAAGFLLQFPFSFSLHHAMPHANIPEWLDISYPGLPFNAQLYSLSYVLITAGAAALLFALIYLFVDAAGVCFYTLLFEWMGRNSLFLFLACATPLLSSIAAGFYWEDPHENLDVASSSQADSFLTLLDTLAFRLTIPALIPSPLVLSFSCP